MGIISQLFSKREHPSQHGQRIWGLGNDTYAGVNVSEESALTLSAVYACIRILGESVAMLPLLTYRRRPDGGKERATDHPLYKLLHRLPNPEMTSFELRELLISHAASWGNGYAEIEWSRSGRPLALWPLNPAKMDVERKSGALRYLYTLPNGQVSVLPAHRIHHIKGLGRNGLRGYSVIRLAMQSIGLGLGTEEFGARLFGNGARPGGVLRHPGRLSDTAYDRLQKSWTDAHEGLSNAHRMKILEEGLEFQAIGIPPEEAQFLETRKFQVSEIARWFRVPPHMLADLERATFNNVEEMSLGFVTYTLQPWLTRHEQAIYRDLLSETEQAEYFCEYLINGLLRGNAKDRSAFYVAMITNGVMTRNEVRDAENLNPYEGGDVALVPLNMIPADQLGLPPADMQSRSEHGEGCTCRYCRRTERRAEDDESPDGEEETTKTLRRSKQKLARDYVGLYLDAAGRIVRREANDVRRAVNKHLRKRSTGDFLTWLRDFYEGFDQVVIDNLRPTMRTYAAAVATATAGELDEDDPGVDDDLDRFIDRYLAAIAQGHSASSRNQLEALIADAEAEGTDPGDQVEARLDSWEERRPADMAQGQAFEAGNALAVALYAVFAVTQLRWAASGASCNFCLGLNGKVVGIERYFVNSGDSVNGGQGDTPMIVRSNTRHGPLHKGCDCVVVAA